MAESATRIRGKVLVRRNQSQNEEDAKDEELHSRAFPVLASNVSLSFWGGIDPLTGIVVDATHPLRGRDLIDTILCLPSGRGSCTASQVLLELILNRKSPRAIVMRDADGLACVGAIVASEVFNGNDDDGGSDRPAGQLRVPDIICVGEKGFSRILEHASSMDAGKRSFGAILPATGEVVLGHEGAVRKAVATSLATAASAPPDSAAPNAFLSLSAEEERMLNGSTSEAERVALNVLFRYARLSSSEPSYLPITNSHIDGCTYIGPGGLRFVQMLVQAGGRVKVPTTLNSVSTDRQRWKALGVPERYAQNSIALGDAYLELGCQPSFTCAPYLLPCPPRLGDDIAWGESNAVVYANSVLGARTEKYADYLDICCALTGFVPAAGVHLAANRLPGIVLDATDLLTTVEELVGAADVDMVFPILGHLCGALSDGKVPILVGLEKWAGRITPDNLKAFCAAFGTTGSSPLIHIAGITPEAENESDVRRLLEGCGDVTRVVSRGLFEETIRTLDSGGGGGALDDDRVQLVALGNPHLSTTECETLSELVTAVGLPKSPDVRVVACISRDVLKSANERHVDTLTRWGVEFVNDTCWCMLLDPPVIPAKRTSKILTNSGKYSHYGPGLTNRAFRFGSLEDCIRTATTGRYASLRQSKICRSASSPFASTTRQLSMHAFYVVHNAIRRWR